MIIKKIWGKIWFSKPKALLFSGSNFRGLVTLKKSLNYEERSSYNLVVEAQDAGDNILSSTASIFVQVSAVEIMVEIMWIKVLENDDDGGDGGGDHVDQSSWE